MFGSDNTLAVKLQRSCVPRVCMVLLAPLCTRGGVAFEVEYLLVNEELLNCDSRAFEIVFFFYSITLPTCKIFY